MGDPIAEIEAEFSVTWAGESEWNVAPKAGFERDRDRIAHRLG